MLRVIQVRPT